AYFSVILEFICFGNRDTSKQAYRNGYYSYPRRCTLDDLARMNGISKNALIKRLKSAERKILSFLFSDS
ncbi:MAG: helix-turn-helix domain-containing protein, partial [Archaeoglobaceae archaeon]